MSALADTSMDAQICPLTPRELTALHGIARDGVTKIVARRLGCTERTIKEHLGNINRKLCTGTAVQAVAYALERGWIRNVTLDRETKWYAHGGGIHGTALPPADRRTRLTVKEVAVIKRRLAAGERQCALAREYEVTACAIWQIKRGRNWKYVVAEGSRT